MEVMTFNIDNDRRNLVDDKQNFSIDFHDSKYNWLQARQYEESMRQVEVHVVHGNGSPVDLTGMNPVFEGWMPEGLYRIIDANHSVMIDAQNGIFRFDFPAPAFQIAGSYKQAFFRLMKDGMSVTTLEFSLDVMADKVISGLVPSDYITPFEDLYSKLKDYITKANGDFDAAMTQWKKDVANLITELNADISGINLTITEIKTQLASLEDKIKADGLLTQAEFDAQIKIVNRQITDALQKLNQTIPMSSSVLIGNPVSESNQSALTNLKSGIDPSLFNLTMITDVHYGEWTTEPQKLNNTTIDHLNNVLTMDDTVDAMVMGGDNVDGWTMSLNNLLKETEKVSNKFMFESDNHSDKFILKGNHDDGAGRISQYLQGDFDYTKWMDGALDYHLTLPSLVSNQQLVEFYQSKSTLFGEKRNGSSLYFYKDYPDKKVRLIGLDSNDIPTMLKQDGSPKYLGLKNMGYQQDQINWLANDALKIPKDYVVLIIGHIPATANGDDQHNQALINQIINAYQQGTSVHAINNDTDWKVDVSADYTLQGKRLIAGYLNGHLHLEDASTTLGFNQISIASSIGNESDQNADAWDVVSIDQKNRKLILKGFGRATNRTFDY